MKQLVALTLFAGTLGGCGVYRDATSPRIDPGVNWRAVATDADRDNLRSWRQAWDEAMPEARAADTGVIAADPALFDPDRALDDPLPPAGDYRCRTFKLGKAGTAPSAFIAYPWYPCRVTDQGKAKGLEKLAGAQRPTGLLFQDSAARAVFLGTLLLGDETAPLRYGIDDDRDIIGYFEKIEPRRWRLVMPYPRFESKLAVTEFVPAN